MSIENTVQTLNGLYKEVYNDGIVDAVPSNTKFMNLVKFKSGEKLLGNKFNFPVILSLENGK
jgi:hypothetical protein